MEDPRDAQHVPSEVENRGSRRDPEERLVQDEETLKDKMLDKTLADSFPSSDPPSSIPDPRSNDSLHDGQVDATLAGLPAGSWVAISIDDNQVVGTGASSDEAEDTARRRGYARLALQQVPENTDTPLRTTKAA